MATKLAQVKLANAIRVGTKVENFLQEKLHDIELDGMMIKVWPKGNRTEHPDETSLMNAIYWKRSGVPMKESVADVTSAPTVGSSKKKTVSKVA